MSDYAEQPRLPKAEHERTDVALPGFLALLACFASLAVLGVLLILWLFPASLHDEAIPGRIPDFPSPRHQANDRSDMSALFEAQMAELNGTGWVDRGRGVVHIPIGQAMRKVARDGIADWPTTAPPPGVSAAGGTAAAPAAADGGR